MLNNLMVLFVLQLIHADNPFDPPFQEKCAQDKDIDNSKFFGLGTCKFWSDSGMPVVGIVGLRRKRKIQVI